MESIGAPRGLPLGRSKRGYVSAYATAGGVPAPKGKLGEWVSVAPGGLVGSKTFYSRDQPGAGRTCRRELFTAGTGLGCALTGWPACLSGSSWQRAACCVSRVPRRLEGKLPFKGLVAQLGGRRTC